MKISLPNVAPVFRDLSIGVFFCLLIWIVWGQRNILLHADGVLTRTEVTLSKAYATLNNLDKGTKVWADSAKGQAQAVEGLTRSAHGTLTATDDTLRSLQGVSQHTQTAVDAIPPMLQAGTGLLTEAQTTVKQVNTDLPPLMANVNGSVTRFNALLDSPDLKTAMDKTALTMTHVETMTDNGAKVTTHYEQIIDNPKKSPLFIRLLPPTLRVTVQAAADYFATKGAQK